MKQEKKWTFGKTLLALFIVIDLIVIGIWLLIYFDKYQQIATIVGGIWAAVVALLGFFGIRGGKIVTLSALFDLRPIKYIGVTLTILILIGSPLFILWEFDSHPIEVIWGTKAESMPALIRIVNNETGEQRSSHGNVPEFRTWLKKGNYQIIVMPEDTKYREMVEQVTIKPFQLKVHKVFINFPLTLGTLIVIPHPDSIRLSVTHKATNSESFSSDIHGTETVPLEPGEYIIEAKAPNFNQYNKEITIAPGITLTIEIDLTRTTGTLFLNPQEANMEIFIKGKHYGKTPQHIPLTPGNYDVVLMKPGEHESLAFHFEQKGVRVSANSVTPINPPNLQQKEYF